MQLKLKISGCFFSIVFLLLFVNPGYCQEGRTYGPRIGIDLARIPPYFMSPEKQGFELSVDAEMLTNFYPVIEIGKSKLTFESGLYDHYCNGSYFRVGFDYNILKYYSEIPYDMGFIGLRYGYSGLTYRTDNITIQDNYWGNFTSSIPETEMDAHWLEITGGLRTEIFSNFFMGWTVRAKFMLNKTEPALLYPNEIAGYGKGNKKSLLGVSFSVYYKIPVYRSK
jgi:hypothetical protein